MTPSEHDREAVFDGDDSPLPRSFSDLRLALENGHGHSSDAAAPVDGTATRTTRTASTSISADSDSTPTGSTGGFGDLAEAIVDRRSRDGWEWVNPKPDSSNWPAAGRSDGTAMAIAELPDTASNVLVSGPLHCPSEYDLCTKLLAPDSVGTTNALLVTFARSLDERLSIYRGYLGGLPDETVVVDVGNFVRSAATTPSGTVTYDGLTVETITDPTDLARLGMTVSKYLAKWERASARSAVCVHSLTALLQVVNDVRAVFRFLHVLQGRVEAVEATAHYHIDPDAHDEQLLSTLEPLFDTTLDYSEDGAVSIDDGDASWPTKTRRFETSGDGLTDDRRD